MECFEGVIKSESRNELKVHLQNVLMMGLKTEILAGNGRGHCELALTLYLCDLICFTLFVSPMIP